jgi:hypothetical protein
VEYIIYTPDETNLVINNEYGSCSFDRLNAFINVNMKYGKIELSKIKGLVRIYAMLCHIEGTDIGGEVSFLSSNSDYELGNLSGKITIENNVGKLNLRPGAALKSMIVKCEHSEIEINTTDPSQYSYNLTAKNGRIQLPDKEGTFHNVFSASMFRTEDPKKAMIEVHTTFNDIKLH